jgi:hypothetical protein
MQYIRCNSNLCCAVFQVFFLKKPIKTIFLPVFPSDFWLTAIHHNSSVICSNLHFKTIKAELTKPLIIVEIFMKMELRTISFSNLSHSRQKSSICENYMAFSYRSQYSPIHQLYSAFWNHMDHAFTSLQLI